MPSIIIRFAILFATLFFSTSLFSQTPGERLLLDEEGAIQNWKSLSVNKDPAFVKTGKVSAAWTGVSGRSFASPKEIKAEDWSGFKQLSFWAYSGAANGSIFAISLASESSSPGDAFFKLVTVDWQGWKKIEIPFSTFNKNRNPKGWQSVTGPTFMSEGYGAKSKADTVLYFDDMKLEKVSSTSALNNPDDAGPAGLASGDLAYRPQPESARTRFPVFQSARVIVQGGGVRGFGMLARYEASPREIYLRRVSSVPASEPYAPITTAGVVGPDGNQVAFWECTDQKIAEEEMILQIPAGKPGIWRVSFTGGRSGDQLDIGLPATANWGVRGEMALGITPTTPKKSFLFLPRTIQILLLESSGSPNGIELFDERGKSLGSPLAATRRNFFTLSDLEPQSVLTLQLDREKTTHLAFDGVPGLLCPSAAAAKSLAGGAIEAEGLLTAGPLQARARKWMVAQKDKNVSPGLSFPAALPAPLKNPRVDALFYGKYGPLMSLKSVLNAQILDAKNPYYGVFLPPQKPTDAPLVNWESFLYGPVRSPFDASALAGLVVSESPVNPAYGNEAILLRATLSAFYHLSSLQGDDIARENDLRSGSYPVTHIFFSYEGALAKPFFLLKDKLSPEARKIWEEGLIAVGRKLADYQAYESNQWMHIIRGHLYTYMATRRKEFLGFFERFMNAFLDNTFGPSSKFGQHPAGFFLEEGGPDGNYDHLSSYGLVSGYYDYSHMSEAKPELLAKMKKAIEKNLYFKSFYWLPQPGGEIPGVNAVNCRTTGSLGNPSYPGDYMASPKFPLAAARLLLNRDPGTGTGMAGTFSHAASSDAWARRVIEWGLSKKDEGFPDIYNAMGSWMTDIREAYSLPQEASPAPLPCDAENGFWEIPGQFAWKRAGIYGLVFYDVIGSKLDLRGKMGGGPTALWTKETGSVIAGMNDPKKTIQKPSEIGHSCVFGEDASGKFFSTGLGTDRATFSKESATPETGNVQIVSPVKNPGLETKWSYRWNADGAKVSVSFPADKVSSSYVSLPIYAGEKDAGLGLDKNTFTYTLGTGAVELSWPASVEAKLEPCDFPKVKRLVLKIPAQGILEIAVRKKS